MGMFNVNHLNGIKNQNHQCAPDGLYPTRLDQWQTDSRRP